MPREFDLVPDPRLLPMLGEIELDHWRCVAEIIDNSIDAFIDDSKNGKSVENYEVTVKIPISRSGESQISIRDNASGMNLEKLELAVKAGWTSQDAFGSLGMFGMGFNIATARLGRSTTVWTTRKNDQEWYGLKIDFDQLIKQRHFKTPSLTRPKENPDEHGTEIIIQRIKEDQLRKISRADTRHKISRHLAKAYSTMLRANGVPISFRLIYNGHAIQGLSHCVWGDENSETRIVQSKKYGSVNGLQIFDKKLGDRRVCNVCFYALLPGEESCPSCEDEGELIVLKRRIYGWIGLQRYLHNTDYGIDFVRHGRKIEFNDKELFFWTDEEGNEEEYPIDDPRHRGRIVGEVHLDHCRVAYTKDRFERTDPAWKEMVQVVRGQGPLRPQKASALGYPENTSPLFLLYQIFRRNSPQSKVPGAYRNLLLAPNELAQEYSKKFEEGIPEYQSDEKWWELIEETERALIRSDEDADSANESLPDGFIDIQGGQGEDSGDNGGDEGQGCEPERIKLSHYCQDFRDDTTNTTWSVTVYEVSKDDPILKLDSRPWILQKNPGGEDIFYVNLKNDIFMSKTMTLIDAILYELAVSAYEYHRTQNDSVKCSDILNELRRKYAVEHRIDMISATVEAKEVLREIYRGVQGRLEESFSVGLFDELGEHERNYAFDRMSSAGVENPQNYIQTGQFLEFTPPRSIIKVFERHPEMFLDGNYWDEPYKNLDYGTPTQTEETRSRLVRYYGGLLSDASWLADQEPIKLSRQRVIRSLIALDLLRKNVAVERE